MNLPLIQFDLSDEWIIDRNIFTEACPDLFINDDYGYKWEFNEDILQITNTNRKRIIDLGWYPEFSYEGQYCLLLVTLKEDRELQAESWEEPIIKHYTRNINEVNRMIKELIHKVNQGII